MTPLARGYGFVMYLATAGAAYTLPFPYLHADDIRVFAGDVGDAVEQTFSWDGTGGLKLDGGVPEGILVTIRRFTQRDHMLVSYVDGAQLPADDLNRNAKQLLYIVQEEIDFGMGGNGLPGGSSGWPAAGGGDTSLAIQQIIDALMQSSTMQLLLQRIEPVDDLAETVLEDILRDDQMFDTRRSVDQRVAFVETTITQLVTDTTSTATQVTELYAQHDSLAAQVIVAQQAIADETSARAEAITQAQAATSTADAKASQALQAVSDETSARASAVTQVTAATTAAQSTATQALQAVSTETTARATAINQVSAAAQGFSTIVDERVTALVNGSPDPSSDPQWSANWAVRINAQKINGDPVIAGVGLGIDSETGSSFIVQADRFGIVSPSYNGTGAGQMKFPFVVGTVGGMPTVGITGQLIVDGSVTADKVSANSLSAISANLGTVNGGTFKTHTLDAQGNVTAPNEFRVEVTNQPTDNYPLWIGSNAKTSANAVFWVDRDGNAMFRGVVSAGNITDKFQVQNTGEWAGSIRASDGGRSSTFTLDAPVRLGETHSPVLMIELGIQITDDDSYEAADASVFVERQVGSTWVELRRQTVSGFKFTTMGSSLFLFDAPTTTAQTYRVGLDSQGAQHPLDVYLINAHAILFGLR